MLRLLFMLWTPVWCRLQAETFTRLNEDVTDRSPDAQHVIWPYVLNKRLMLLGMKESYVRDDDISYPTQDSSSDHDLVVTSTIDKQAAGEYILDSSIFRGGHGEVFSAHMTGAGKRESFVVKKMVISGHPEIARCARREVFFGEALRGRGSFSRFVSYFETPSEYWLVFRDEGVSLQKLLYAMEFSGSTVLLQPSQLWKRFRLTNDGEKSLRQLLQQVVEAVNVLHSSGIVHRDIKPSNILLNTESGPRVVLADFSSAYSETVHSRRLFGEEGPSVLELTPEYAAPEVRLKEVEIARSSISPAYDVWSVGVLMLESILGTPDVFTADQRTASLVTQRVKNTRLKEKLRATKNASYLQPFPELADGEVVSAALLLSAFRDFGIFSPCETEASDFVRYLNLLSSDSSQQMNCTENTKYRTRAMANAIVTRDPLGLGFSDRWGLDLLARLLTWDPADRLPLSLALQHAYFSGSFLSRTDGSEHALAAERDDYDEELSRISDPESVANPTSTTLVVVPDDRNDSKEAESVGRSSASGSLSTLANLQSRELALTYSCPKCRRKFHDWRSCQDHMGRKGHGMFCSYPLESLPQCMSVHPMSAISEDSGWCDLLGHKRTQEDVFSLHSNFLYDYFGVFDGHFGSRTARFAAKHLHEELYFRFQETSLVLENSSSSNDVYRADPLRLFSPEATCDRLRIDRSEMENRLDSLNKFSTWRSVVNVSNGNDLLEARYLNEDSNWLPAAFDFTASTTTITADSAGRSICFAYEMVERMLQASSTTLSTGVSKSAFDGDISGSTSSTVMLFRNHVVVANIGDGRVVLCCDFSSDSLQSRPVVLTMDHVASNDSERSAVEGRGGWVSAGPRRAARVNDVLLVTRSFGDFRLKPAVSTDPDILIFKLLLHARDDNSIRQITDSSGDPLQHSNEEMNDPCWHLRHVLKMARADGHSVMRYKALFIISASDGLWDVVSNREATSFVCSVLVGLVDLSVSEELSGLEVSKMPARTLRMLPENAFQVAATRLAQEAFVRGSTDNIGVNVISLL